MKSCLYLIALFSLFHNATASDTLTFTSNVINSIDSGIMYARTTADINNDGLKDFVLIPVHPRPPQESLLLFLQKSDKQFEKKIIPINGTNLDNKLGLLTGDIDQDGNIDIIVSQ